MKDSLLVTDTHPLVWYITGANRKLPRRVKAAFDEAVEGSRAILIPAVVLWELSLLFKSDIVQSSVSLEEYVKERFFAKAIAVLDLTTEDILLSQKLSFSKDAFDTLIVAMAMRLDCPLISGDMHIHKTLPCELFWD